MSGNAQAEIAVKPPEEAESYDGRLVRRVSAAEGYRLWAPTYGREPNPLHALEERCLRPLLPQLYGKLVLDLACGSGRWLGKLLSWGARAGAGLDLCSDMLLEAASKPALRCRLVQGDCLALPFRSRCADLLICSLGVNHMNDLATFARELSRVARRRANLFVTDFHPAGSDRGWRRTFRHAGRTFQVPNLAYRIEDVSRAMEFEGFKLLQCLEPCLGEPEKSIFAQRGKPELFETACETPVIFICHFRLTGVSSVRRRRT